MKKYLYSIIGTIFLLSGFTLSSPGVVTSTNTTHVVVSSETAKPVNPFENKYTKLAKELTPKVVFIGVAQLEYDVIREELVERRIGGSGVFISKNGHVLTCAHLFTGKNIQQVVIITKDDQMVAAEVLYVDFIKDLALIKPWYELKDVSYAKVTSRQKVEVGEEVIAVGYPMGLGMNFTHGIVTSEPVFIKPSQEVVWTNAVINPGNSGGPLFDITGNIIGINVMIATPNIFGGWAGNSFAVSPKELNTFLDKFRGL